MSLVVSLGRGFGLSSFVLIVMLQAAGLLFKSCRWVYLATGLIESAILTPSTEAESPHNYDQRRSGEEQSWHDNYCFTDAVEWAVRRL